MMDPTSSMLGKDSTIAKRKRIAIIAVVCLVIAVAVIGLAVGVSQKNKHSDKPKQSAPPASPPEQPITTKPGDTPAPSPPNPTLSASSVSIERQADLGDKVDPPLLDSFLAALEQAASQAGPLVKFKVPEKRYISSASLLMYIRDMGVDAILSPLLDFAEGTPIALADVPDLVKAVRKMFQPESILEWGRARAAAHFEGNETAAWSVEQLLVAAKNASRSLPTSTVDVPAPNNSSQTFFPWQAAGGRKMLAKGSFVDICIPVVFHVLQYKKAGDSTYFPGAGFTKAAQRMMSRLNYAFTNSEYTKLFNGNVTNPRIQFRLHAVHEVPAKASYLTVTKGQWKTCDDDTDFMINVASEITVTYPTQKFINVIICGDKVGSKSGYAWVPQAGFDYEAWVGNHIFIRLDEFHPRMNNRPEAYDRGGWTLSHEVGHYLGLSHPHSDLQPPKCVDGDALADTPVTLIVQDQDYYYDLVELCDAWRQGQPLYSNSTGHYRGYSLGKMSSCPPATSPDPVFNIMEYTADSCSSHFTPAQVKYMQYAVPFFRPLLYSSSKGACAAKGGR